MLMVQEKPTTTTISDQPRVHDPDGKCRRIVAFMRGYQRDHGLPPTVREIAAELSITPGNAHGLLGRLVEEETIEETPGQRSRKYRVNPSPAQSSPEPSR